MSRWEVAGSFTCKLWEPGHDLAVIDQWISSSFSRLVFTHATDDWLPTIFWIRHKRGNLTQTISPHWLPVKAACVKTGPSCFLLSIHFTMAEILHTSKHGRAKLKCDIVLTTMGQIWQRSITFMKNCCMYSCTVYNRWAKLVQSCSKTFAEFKRSASCLIRYEQAWLLLFLKGLSSFNSALPEPKRYNTFKKLCSCGTYYISVQYQCLGQYLAAIYKYFSW